VGPVPRLRHPPPLRPMAGLGGGGGLQRRDRPRHGTRRREDNPLPLPRTRRLDADPVAGALAAVAELRVFAGLTSRRRRGADLMSAAPAGRRRRQALRLRRDATRS